MLIYLKYIFILKYSLHFIMTSDKKFYFFHYTRKSVNSCCIAIDTPVRSNTTDAERGEQCVSECSFWFWPIIAVIDMVTLPYRGPKHLIKKCKSNKK